MLPGGGIRPPLIAVSESYRCSHRYYKFLQVKEFNNKNLNKCLLACLISITNSSAHIVLITINIKVKNGGGSKRCDLHCSNGDPNQGKWIGNKFITNVLELERSEYWCFASSFKHIGLRYTNTTSIPVSMFTIFPFVFYLDWLVQSLSTDTNTCDSV